MAKRDPYKEGAPFLATGGFRTAVQAAAADRKAAVKPMKPSQQTAIPPLVPGQTQSISDAINTEALRTGSKVRLVPAKRR